MKRYKNIYVSHLGFCIFVVMALIPVLNLFCWIPLMVFRQDVPTFQGESAGQALHRILKRKTYVSQLGWILFAIMLAIPFLNIFCWVPLLICQQNEPMRWEEEDGASTEDFVSN